MRPGERPEPGEPAGADPGGPGAERGLLPDLLLTLRPEISPVDLLRRAGKERCPGCGKPRTWYCRDCLRPVIPLGAAPVHTAVPILVVRDPREAPSRSSVPGLATLSDVRVLNLPEAERPGAVPEGAVLLMPGPGSREVGEVDWARVPAVVVADCTWGQVPAMLRTGLGALPRVRIGSRRTIFWRSHGQADQSCLSTAEAVYYFLSDLGAWDRTEGRRFTTARLDTLLSFFLAQYCLVQWELYKRNRTQVTARRSAVPDYQHWPEVRALLESRWGGILEEMGV